MAAEELVSFPVEHMSSVVWAAVITGSHRGLAARSLISAPCLIFASCSIRNLSYTWSNVARATTADSGDSLAGTVSREER